MGSTAEGRVLYRCTSEQRHDRRMASAHPSIRSHLTEACSRQLCLFRHGVHGGGTAEANCQMYIQSASCSSLRHNTRLTSRIEYGKRHFHLENATINISIYTMIKLLVFFILSRHVNFVNIAEAAHNTSTVRPPRTPQPARTSQ